MSRRGNRFTRQGHAAGAVDVARLDRIAAAMPREYPRTLDLRQTTL
jgi:hypothetical protein